MAHERLSSIEFLTLLLEAFFNRTYKTFTQCVIHKLFSIVKRHEITIFYVDLRNGNNCSKSNKRWRLLSYFMLS